MKSRMQKRVISFVMTLLMVIGLLPVNFLGGGVTQVFAAEDKSWDLGTGSGFATTIQKTTGEYDGLIVDASGDAGKLQYNSGAGASQMGTGTKLQVPVEGNCTITVVAHSEPYIDYTIGGVKATDVTNAYSYIGGAGYVDIVANSNNVYIKSIAVAYPASGDLVNQLAMMSIGTAAESYNFNATGKIFDVDSMTDDAILSQNKYICLSKGSNTQLDRGGNTHGMAFTSPVTFTTIVPANTTGVFTFNQCNWGNCSAKMLINGVEVSDSAKDLQGGGEEAEVAFEYQNKSSSAVHMELVVTTGGTGYVHGVSYEVKEIALAATVTGSVDAVLNGEELIFKNGDTQVATAIVKDGGYSVELEVGSSYTVEFKKSALFKITNGATVDLTSAAAGDAVTNDIQYEQLETPRLTLDAPAITYTFTSSIFGSTSSVAADTMSPDGILTLNGTGMSYNSGGHGLVVGNGSEIAINVPAGQTTVVVTACVYGGSSKAGSLFASLYRDGLKVTDDVDLYDSTDGKERTLIFTSDKDTTVVVKVEGSGSGYFHYITAKTESVQPTATVSGTIANGAAVNGEKLVFKKDGAKVAETTVTGGAYTVDLPIGSKYTVEFENSGTFKIAEGGTADLTGTTAGATVTNNITYVAWDTTKTATVTLGGTTFTIQPGADDKDVFKVTAAGGDGSVEFAGVSEAIIWADLGGAGNGAVSNVTYGGATGTVKGNQITVTFDGNTLPESYVLNVKDNSASGVPVKDGATKSYNLTDGSVISKLYDNNHAITGGKTVAFTDKLVSFTANNKIYAHDTTHGIAIADGDVITVKVAGNATITFSLCQHSQNGENLVAAASTGKIYVSGDESSNSVPMVAGSDGGVSTFIYEGDAATLTFTLEGSKANENYIHSMTVTNEAEKTTTNEDAVKVKPETLTGIGVAGNLTVTPNGQKLNFVQTGGQMPSGQDTNFTQSGVSFYAFPETADWNKLELEVKINSIEANSNANGVFVGAINTNASNRGEAIATVGVRKNNNLRGIYSKAAEYAGGGQANATIPVGDTVKYTVYKADDAFYIESVWSEGTNTSEFNYSDSAFAAFQDNGAATPVSIGLVLAGVNADVMNMVYTDKDGEVLFDQNAYYNPLGAAPEAKSASAEASADRTYINVTWTGTQVYGDGKFVLQVSKDGGEWEEISSTLTGYSYQYPVASTASGVYKFRVCGTLGQSLSNRNTFVESNEVTIIAALQAPVVTVSAVSPADKVNLSWTVTPQATSYEVYRRSADEAKSTLIATVTGTSYTDEAVTAEVPYYYYVIAKSADNFSNPQEEVWTLPTAGAGGEYSYDGAAIVITKKSYDTIFDGKVTVEGIVTAPGKVSLLVNGTVAATANVPAANGKFSFTDAAVAEGRNDVEVILEYDTDKKVRKPLNFVYLTNYDYVVDAFYEGTPGDTTQYGVPQYATIGAAISAVSTSNTQRKVIFIREGSYEERLDISTPYLSLIGEDSTKTIIHNYPGNYSQTGERGGTMGDRAAMRTRAEATGFSVENLTIQNDWEYKGDGTISNESADVIHNEAEGAMYVNVRFLGYQDTICANKNHQYYYKCYIAGNVDFIYGNSGMALFNDCDIVFRYNANKNSGYVTAMKNDLTTSYGALFNECRITGESGCSGTEYYLGRPWGEESATTFIDCYMSGVINRNVGWTTWGGKEFSTDKAAFDKVRYYEHGSYGAGAMVNLYRRQLSDTQAQTMLSTGGLGWDPYGNMAVVSSSYYVGSKQTPATDKFVTEEYETDTYSPYEGDDTGLGKYNLEGYAQSAATTGGGLLKENNANYYKVATAKEFLDALKAVQAEKQPSVIEITADLNLGSKEVADFASYSGIISAHNASLTHPELLNTGVSKINLRGFNDLTIFSSNGSSIKHASIDIRESSNIMIRNVTFDELWEWDEKDKGDYDTNDWDYIVIQDGSDRIWIDHCTFYKAYDGVVDIKTNKDAPTNVTVSWCEFLPGSENNTFFNAMMDAMAANPNGYPYYKSLLDSGMTEEQIWWYAYGQKKTHLLGQNDDAVQNANLNVTLANNYYYNSMDRMPRLRFGNSHVYNCVMDSQELYDARASISNADAAKHIVSNGASSTCGGKLLIENSYMNGIINVLNSGNGSSPAGYINAVDSLYYINGTRYALTPKVNTTKPGETVLILDADAFVQSLPYSDYVLYDAAQLKSLVVPFAGAGKLNLTVLQWEKGAYTDTAWTAPDDNSNYGNEGLPDYVEVETPDGNVVVIGDGIAIDVEEGVIFKDSKGNIITNGKIYVKAVPQDTSSLAGKINLGSDDKARYYDVSLVDEAGNKVTLESGKITLIFNYPDGTNRFDYNFKVYHGLNSGKVEQLGVSCNDAGIRVKVDSFSPFAIVYTEKPKNTENPDEPGEYEGDTVQSVPTGDSTPVVPLAVMMFISAGVCTTFFFKKRKNA